MKRIIAQWIAQGFGVGRAPVAPGTFGTLVGIPFYLIMQDLSIVTYLSIALAMYLLGVWASGITEAYYGEDDHQSIVWDEVVGFVVTMAAAPAHWIWIVIGFVVFRFYDIVKPWPVCWFDQRLPRGWGVMTDDLMAGVYGALTVVVFSQMFHV